MLWWRRRRRRRPPLLPTVSLGLAAGTRGERSCMTTARGHVKSPERPPAPESCSTQFGFREALRSLSESLSEKRGSFLVMINSVCGCAAGNARPAVKMAAKHSKVPNKLTTVFAGQDKEAVAKVRDYCLPYPPSSPSIALFKDGELVHFIERHHIEGRPAVMIAENLMQAFDENC